MLGRSGGEKCCRRVLEKMLEKSVGEESCQELLQGSVVEKCRRRVLEKSVVEKWWGEVL